MSTAVMTTIRHLSTVETREEHWFAFSIKCINILKGVWSLLVQYHSTSETWSFWIQHCVWMFIHIDFHLDSLFRYIYIVRVNGYIVFIIRSVSSNSYLQFSGKQSGHLLARLWWKDDILSCNTPPHTHTHLLRVYRKGVLFRNTLGLFQKVIEVYQNILLLTTGAVTILSLIERDRSTFDIGVLKAISGERCV